VLAGQWFAETATLDQVALETISVARGDAVVVTLGDARILVQPHGADRRLPGLHSLVARSDATLVSHRPERRALVRLGGERYAKVIPPARVSSVLRALEAASRVADASFSVPGVLEIDEPAGVIELKALRGLSLRELVEDELPIEPAARAVGRALAALHASAPPDIERRHGPVEEAAVVLEWLRSAAAHVPERAAAIERKAPAVLELLAKLPASPARLVHRDFHDKQPIVAAGGRVGLLDFDTLACGDATVDLANLLVHLELRSVQGHCPEARAERAAKALLDGYSPEPEMLGRLQPYADATRIRLACVYAYRPRWVDVPDELLARLGRLPPIHAG
jgi:aminoglycoside phosphotransferase (APT) family kinase protein